MSSLSSEYKGHCFKLRYYTVAFIGIHQTTSVSIYVAGTATCLCYVPIKILFFL